MTKLKYLLTVLLLAAIIGVSPVGAQEEGEFTLTILHNNDGESQLLNAGSDLADFGGIARFATLVNQLRSEAVDGSGNTGVVLLSSGDNFLAGPEWNASQEKGVPFYDSIGIRLIGYDAMAIGNHEFDFGPDVLAEFIQGVEGEFPFVSANLDFSGESTLQDLVDSGNIVKSVVIDEEGQQIGVVGATSPQIPFISSPRNVQVDPDVAGVIQAEIDALEAEGVNKIIVISHLQSVNEDIELAGQLSGVDVMIAGGGDELLADEDTLLVPGDEEPFGSYPLSATTADGADIPVVTTAGDYKYVGKLVVTFDADGNVTSIGEDSDLVRVAGGDNPDAVVADPDLEGQVVTPVASFVEDLAGNVIATSEVALEGRRDPGIRTMETNLGSLMADALLWEGARQSGRFGVAPPTVALQNGGGIRNNTLIPAGEITELTTFDIAPFSNFVTVVYNISPQQFKDIMENAVSQAETAGGRFAQIAGFTIVYDPAGTPMELDEDNNIVTPGERVQSITLEDGSVIVEAGAVVDGAPSVNVATIDFLARGGDQYLFGDARFTSMGVSYQQALSNYITEALGGTISAEQYPEDGAGRITTVGDEAMAEEGTEEGAMEEGAMEDGAMAEDEAATQVAGCEVYVVQADDWLSRIAEKFLGDVLAYTQIADATNAAVAAGGDFDPVDNVDVIEVGQRLCIPTEETAAPADDASTSDDATGEAASEAEAGEDAAGGTTVVDLAVGDEQFSTLVAALQAADLVETLQGDGPFTVFAPTNDAFAALPEGALDELLADVPALTNVLLYHVVPDSVLAADVVNLTSADTVFGQPLTITVDGETVQINEATVVTTDLEADNGVIHVIDAVLLPPSDASEEDGAMEDGAMEEGTDEEGAMSEEESAETPDVVVPEGKGILRIENIGADLVIDVVGGPPEAEAITIGAGETTDIVLDPGTYTVQGSTPGGAEVLEPFEVEITEGQVLIQPIS